MVPDNVRGHYASTVMLWIDIPKEQRVTLKELKDKIEDEKAYGRRWYRPYRDETRLHRIQDPVDGCRAAVKIKVKRRTKFAPCSSGMGDSPSDYFCKQHRYGDSSRFRSSTSWKRVYFQSPIKIMQFKLQSPIRWRNV